jgi:hypothetical protein
MNKRNVKESTKRHMRHSSTSAAGKLPYDLYCVGKTQPKKKVSLSFIVTKAKLFGIYQYRSQQKFNGKTMHWWL